MYVSQCEKEIEIIYLCSRYSPVPNNKGGRVLLIKEGGVQQTTLISINGEGGVQIKVGLEIVLGQKKQPVIANYGDCFD